MGDIRLHGSWPFSSGVASCEWNMLASVVASDDEADGIEYRIFLFPRRTIRFWIPGTSRDCAEQGRTMSRSGTPSLPSDMTVAVSDLAGGPTPGSTVNPNPLYTLPVFSLFPYVLSGVALGNAQACLDDYIEVARHRTSTYNRAKLGDFQSTQIKIAEASAKIDAARLIMRSACLEAMEECTARQIPDMATKTRYRRDGAYSVNLCTEAVSMLFAASGARGLVHDGRVAAAVSRCACNQFASRIQFRCGRDQLRPCGAWPAVRKSDAVRPADE